MQTIQNGPNFRFTELCSNLENPPNNNIYNVYNLQKEHVTKFYKIISL